MQALARETNLSESAFVLRPTNAAADAASEIVVPLAGGANALWWDAASSTLYLTDNNADALVRSGIAT